MDYEGRKRLTSKEVFSIPNIMGYARILLIPVFCYLYFTAETNRGYLMAAMVVLISTVTDFLDGTVARKFDMITELGKFIDPLADKLTHGAIAICLAYRYPLMRAMIVLMIVKEGFMGIMGLIKLRKGKKLDGAMWFGKVCTAFLFTVMFVLMAIPMMPELMANVLICCCMVVMTATLILYIPVFKKM